MSTTWNGAPPPASSPIGFVGWCRVALRAVPLVAVVFGGLLLTLLLRLIERPVWGAARPITPHITVFVCRAALRIFGIRLSYEGAPIQGQGAFVANHSSWLDIFVLNARKRIYFVSKSEVAGWPGIGALARATGTVFIERRRAQAGAQAKLFQHRLTAGHRLLFFPEGTSSDNLRVLPFKSSLFAAFFDAQLKPLLSVQPITVRYTATGQQDPRFLAWWGDMDFAPHFLKVLAGPAGARVHLIYHKPFRVAEFKDRKALAAACEGTVRCGHEAASTA
ncbi:MAG: lysophospholipid acyltransferase family protein [Roseobacter sp.]